MEQSGSQVHGLRQAILRLVLMLAFGIAIAVSISPAKANSPFAPPAAFADDIHFWTRIYTEVGTDGGLLHDDRLLGVVYEVMKFPRDLSPKERSRRINAAKDRYGAILKKFATGEKADDAQTQRVRALWPEKTSAFEFREAAERIRFQLGQANRFKEGLIRAGAYEAHIAETLSNMGLPPELAALPHVESSFDPSAYSHAGAAGLWQFIRSTGRRYMRIDADVDERMDPYLSTVAAARFLKFNYDLLGSWPLALTAYNHGPAGMRRAKERVGTDDIVKISRTYESRTFGFASRNYYIAFLAALEVDGNVEKYFGQLQRHPELKTRSVTLESYVPVASLERLFDVDAQTLRRMNPSLTSAVWRGQRRVPRGFELRLPESLSADPKILLASLGTDERFDKQGADRARTTAKVQTEPKIAARDRTPSQAKGETKAQANARVKAEAKAQAKADTEDKARAKAEAKAAAAAAAVAAQAPPPAPPAAELPVTVAEVAKSDREVAQAENAEPVSEEVAESGAVSSERSDLSADPSDYTVAEDMTIGIEAAETLGHIAEWLDLRASRLRELNKMRGKTPVIIGRRLTIELTQVSVDEFERRRRAYHQQLQEDFFAANRIVGTEVHIVRRGESLWSIAQKNPRVPIWLLRQHNPDIDFSDVKPKTPIVMPIIEDAGTPVAQAAL